MPKAPSSPTVLTDTPAELGYSFPAEFAPHAATWFSWPRPEGISFPGKYHTVPENIAAFIREIALREIVCINVPNENYQRIVMQQLLAGGVRPAHLGEGGRSKGEVTIENDAKARIRFFYIPTNEAWCRDHGPAFVQKRSRAGKLSTAIVDWGFNAWGGKYPPYDSDDAVPTRIAEKLGKTLGAKIDGIFYPNVKGKPVVMEGGSVEFNGRGTILTSEACLLNKNRNPHLSRKEIEAALCAYYGQHHVLWLHDGIVGDDTDGHIDDLARFISPHTIVTTLEDDPKDENYAILQDNYKRLLAMRDQDGKPFDIVTIPMPGRVEFDGQRLPATYANFYFVNGALLVPTYRHKKNDKKTLATLQELLPDREVIGIDSTELIWGLGSVHCLSQQVPALTA